MKNAELLNFFKKCYRRPFEKCRPFSDKRPRAFQTTFFNVVTPLLKEGIVVHIIGIKSASMMLPIFILDWHRIRNAAHWERNARPGKFWL